MNKEEIKEVINNSYKSTSEGCVIDVDWAATKLEAFFNDSNPSSGKTVTAHQFLEDKGVKSTRDMFSAFQIEEWLNEFSAKFKLTEALESNEFLKERISHLIQNKNSQTPF